MQLPDVVNVEPARRNSFPGQLPPRQSRRPAAQTDGSILQALNLMNNPFVENRWHTTGATASQLIVQEPRMSNTDLVNTLYLDILSRYPTATR